MSGTRDSMVLFAALAAVAGAAFAQDNNGRAQPEHAAPTHDTDQGQGRRDQAAPSTDANGTRRDMTRGSDERDSQRGAQGEHHVASSDDNDTVARYRREHPSAAARCKDGFFTRTSDRKFACSKHGGVDVWLLM